MSAALQPYTTLLKRGKRIPTHLVREAFGGISFYYPDYRAVMNQTKTLEDIMADSTLQWILKEQIGDRLKANLDMKRYRVGRGEVGIHLGPNENMGLDIAVFERAMLSSDQIGGKYANVAPRLVIEIDINIETAPHSNNLFEDYAMLKIKRLLEFGVQKVIWIFTKSRMVFIAEPEAKWFFDSWEHEIELMDGIRFNVYDTLVAEGVDPEKV